MEPTILNLLNKTVLKNNDTNDSPKFSLGDVVVDKYKVVDKISVSTTGEADIYKVSSLSDNSDLVVKIYRRNNSSKNDVLDKLKIINNKNVGQILEYGDINGFTYIVMPFYKNGSLENFIQQNLNLDKTTLKPIIESIIEGLKAIHESQILHKDLKPANMMISDDGTHIKLIDFGISSVLMVKQSLQHKQAKLHFIVHLKRIPIYF
jgi:serine/threonine protein kinase